MSSLDSTAPTDSGDSPPTQRQADTGDQGGPPNIPSSEEVQRILAGLQARLLQPHHLEDLRSSGLNDETIQRAGLCSATAEETETLGFHSLSSLVIPYLQFPGYVRVRPDNPRVLGGRRVKYETTRGGVNHLYLPGSVGLFMGLVPDDNSLIITEGEKKALKASQEGFPTIAVPGVWGWKGEPGALQELNQMPWSGCQARIVYDSDVITKVDVKEAISALSLHLRSLRANVRVVVLPDIDGYDKTGLDDFLVARGPEAFQQLIDGAQGWFPTLLEMLRPGLSEDALEEQLGPIYRFILKAYGVGSVTFEGTVKRLRQRLKDLNYDVPPVTEFKRAVRQTDSYTPEWAAHQTRTNDEVEVAPRFVIEDQSGRFGEQLELHGLYDVGGEEPRQLSNLSILIERDVAVEDEILPRRRFEGRIWLLGREYSFQIDAKDFANNSKLIEKIFETAGPKSQILCRPEILRTAISEVSSPEHKQATTDFGWTPDGDAYRTPSGVITASGFRSACDEDEVVVDLSEQEFAKRLDLRPLEPTRLQEVKQHIVADLLCLHTDRHVGFSMLATMSLAVLYHFLDGFNRVVVWIKGDSGAGKSFFAKLLQNFFGDFPIGKKITNVTWVGTFNRIPDDGYYYKDAVFLVDDYKPEHCPERAATRVLQSYADSAARSRLRRDSTPAKTRQIRGLLLSTGEDVPDHSASASARTVKVPFATRPKDLMRGRRCLDHRTNYSGVTADFICHLLANNRPQAFKDRVAELQAEYYSDIAGQQNDVRIASNFAMLGAAFEEIASYFADVWPEHAEAIIQFVTSADSDLRGLRDAMVLDVREQSVGEIFLATLAGLVRQGAVKIKFRTQSSSPDTSPNAALIGREISPFRDETGAEPEMVRILEIWTDAARAEVQQALRRQGRPELKVSSRALLDQLVEAGVLLDENNQPISREAQGDRTRAISVEGQSKRAFRIRADVLGVGDPPPVVGVPAGRGGWQVSRGGLR